MGNISNCTLPACDLGNLSKREQVHVDMDRQDLLEFGFNHLVNVVACSVMSSGKRRNIL